MTPVNLTQNFRGTFFDREASRAALLNENATSVVRTLFEHGSRQLKESNPTQALIIAGLVVGLVIVICCKMRPNSAERQYARAIAPPPQGEREMMRI